QTLTAGTSLSLTVTATGPGPLGYQWTKNGSPISGATASSLQIASAQATDAGIYAVRISSGEATMTSANATITVTPPNSPPPPTAPMIAAQPASQNLAVGAQLLLTVTATGSAPINYQWTKNGSPISGATGPFLQIAAV